MKIKTSLLTLLAASSILAPCYSEDPKELLRQALFAEESEGDLKTATKHYEAILKAFEAERKTAATALYRLAVVKRKQGDEKAALAHYKELVQKFSDIQPQADLAKKDYLALSPQKTLPVAKHWPGQRMQWNLATANTNTEAHKLAELKQLSISHPDRLNESHHLREAIANNWSQVIHYLLKEKKYNPNRDGILLEAISAGNIVITKQLLESGIDLKHKANEDALTYAIRKKYWHTVKLLEKHGASTVQLEGFLADGTAHELSLEKLKYLVKLGANPNHLDPGRDEFTGSPLMAAIYRGHHQYAENLLLLGAKVNLAKNAHEVTALHIAAAKSEKKMVQLLLKAGADPNAICYTRISFSHGRTSIGTSKDPIRPIDLARTEEIRQMLIKAGTKVDKETKNSEDNR